MLIWTIIILLLKVDIINNVNDQNDNNSVNNTNVTSTNNERSNIVRGSTRNATKNETNTVLEANYLSIDNDDILVETTDDTICRPK